MSAALPHSIAWIVETSRSDEVAARPRASISVDADASSSDWVRREDDLKAIRRYYADWDGMGAEAPDPRVVDNAIRFLAKLRRESFDLGAPDAAVASPTGSIILIWNAKGGTYVEAEITEMWHVDWMFDSPSGTRHVAQDWDDAENRAAIDRGATWSESEPISREPASVSSGD